MAEVLKAVNVVTVGVGLTGAILGKELAAAGLKVVGIERGPARDTVPDFQSPAIHDELRFAIRMGLMQDNVKEAVTFRNSPDQTALPMRRWEGFLPGTGLGGAAVHWNGQTYRFQPADFIYKTHLAKDIQACNNCHRRDGAGIPPAIPYLAGQYAQYIVFELQMWKRGFRKNSPESMALIAKQLDDREIAAVAAFYQEARSSAAAAASK
jgi:cytochrome c553